MHNAFIILATGKGERFKNTTPKQFLPINSKPILLHSLDTALRTKAFNTIVLVLNPEHESLYTPLLHNYQAVVASKQLLIVKGGVTRSQSSYLGLKALSEFCPPTTRVLLHDAARPFVSESLMLQILNAIEPQMGVIPVVQSTDSLINSETTQFLNREVVKAIQTPQGFMLDAILKAYESIPANNLNYTDDSSVFMTQPKHQLTYINSDTHNRKITYPEDALIHAEIRCTHAYDLHVFEVNPSRSLKLCGVVIPHSHSLKGHSDADVGLHALTDALLASLSLGDLGTFFPASKTEPNQDSQLFLDFALQQLQSHHVTIRFVDITLITETPRITPHVARMRSHLSLVLNLPIHRISVKSKSNDSMDSIGQGLACACLATVTTAHLST